MIRETLHRIAERIRDANTQDTLNVMYGLLFKERGDFTRADGHAFRQVGDTSTAALVVVCSARHTQRHEKVEPTC